MIVVVGGQARKVGKTRAVCEIIAATPGARWLACKITPHSHGPVFPDDGGDTARFLRAGASEAILVQSDEIPATPGGRNVIYESNAAAEQSHADLFLFVIDPEQTEWKDSGRRVAPKADFIFQGSVPPEALERIRRAVSGSQPLDPPDSPHLQSE